MSKAAKILLFIGLGVLATGVIISVIAFALNGFNIKAIARPASTSENSRLETKEYTIKETFDDIDIQMSAEDVFIQKSTDGVCRVKLENVYKDSDYTVGVKNGTLEVKDTNVNWDSGNVFENILDVMENGVGSNWAKVTVYLPETEYKVLAISTASGEIFTEEKLSFSEADLASASGTITAKNLNTETVKKGAEANIATASGEVFLENCNLDSLNVATASGDVVATDLVIASDMKLETTSGDVVIKNLKVDGTASIRTVSGEVSTSKSNFREGSVETVSGEVHLDMLDAEKMTIETTSGDVVGMIDSNINVHGETASGNLHAPAGNKGNWKIRTVSGDIELN